MQTKEDTSPCTPRGSSSSYNVYCDPYAELRLPQDFSRTSRIGLGTSSGPWQRSCPNRFLRCLTIEDNDPVLANDHPFTISPRTSVSRPCPGRGGHLPVSPRPSGSAVSDCAAEHRSFFLLKSFSSLRIPPDAIYPNLT